MITHETDVIYGRVGGAALLADLAYPTGGELLSAHCSTVFLLIRVDDGLG